MADTTTDNAADLASILAKFGLGQKADRLVEGDYTQNWDKLNLTRAGMDSDRVQNDNLLALQRAAAERARVGGDNEAMLAAQSARNANELDALRKLRTTSYIMGGGAGNYKPPTITNLGRSVTLPDFGFGPRAPSEAEMTGARSLQAMLMPRLASGGSFLPTALPGTPEMAKLPTPPALQPLADYAKPGTSEKIGNYGGSIIGGLGAINEIAGGKLFGQVGKLFGLGGAAGAAGTAGKAVSGWGGGQAPVAAGSKLGIVGGKIVPIAGIAAGAYGLLQDRGKAMNAMNGAQAGAGIGTLIAPGVGTAVGAGIGALGGMLRGAFGQSPDEKMARDGKAQTVSMLTQSATPQEIAESQNAGWKNPQDALARIVLRNKLMAAGLPDTSGPMLDQLFNASGKGKPEAVVSASNAILDLLGKTSPAAAANPAATTTTPTATPPPQTPAPVGRPAGW